MNPVLLAVLAGGGVGLLALIAGIALAEREPSLETRLGETRADEESAPEGAPTRAQTGFVRLAVDLTDRMAGGSGLLDRVEKLLEQANLPLRPAEALFFYLAAVGLLGLLVMLSAPSLPVAIVFTLIVAFFPLLLVKRQKGKRIKAFDAQLPETLNLLSGSLRAGYSFLQGVEAVAHESGDPMGRELRRVLAEARLGRPLDVALSDMATRMQSRDFEWAVLAIRIQREVGGNLAELLQTVSETMVQRGRMKGEIKALTAEGRMSGAVMGALPVALGGYMFVVSPDYIGLLFSSTTGWIMLAGAVVMGMAGFAWIQKIIKIEV